MVRPQGRRTPEKKNFRLQSTVRTIWTGNCGVLEGGGYQLATDMAPLACGPLAPRGGSIDPFSRSKDGADLSIGKDTVPSHPFVQKWAVNPALCYCRSSLWVQHGLHKASLFKCNSLLFFHPAHPCPCWKHSPQPHHLHGRRPKPTSCQELKMELVKMGGRIRTTSVFS